MGQNNLISPTNNKLQDDGVSGGLVSSVEDQSDVKTLSSPYNQVRVLVFVGVVSATILLLVQVDVPCCQLWGWKKNNLVALGSDKNPAYAVDKQPSRETSNAETIGSEEWFYTECETAVMT